MPNFDPTSANSGAELLSRCRGGDESAANELFVRFAERLCRLSERHLSQRLAARIDGEDVVQSVFRSFLVRAQRGEFCIDDSSQLWRLLVTITLQKTREAGRKNTARQRDASRDVSLNDDVLEMISGEPSPEAAVVLADEVSALLAGLTPWHAQVLEARLAGDTPTEIAARHGTSRQAVYRALTDFQNRLDQATP